MSFLQSITPINLLEEKAKFLADASYNPQFKYAQPVNSDKLLQHGYPQTKYSRLAQEIVDQAYHHRNEQDLMMTEGRVLSQAQVEQKITSFLSMHGLDKRFKLMWSSGFIARTTINKDTIKLRLPVEFRQDGLLSMLYHEIGTHALRRINYEHQPWFKKRLKYGLTHDYLKTEEGLASLHSLLPQSFKSAHSTALRYLLVDYAQHHSFAELWQLAGKYVQNLERRWMICLREKRGLEDTSQPGGYSKDLVYFEGMVDVWQYLNKHDFDITQLYFGKIAWQDVEIAIAANPGFRPQLPSFYTLDAVKYGQLLQSIGSLNHFN